MENTLSKFESKAGEILITALVAVGMSVMQSILENHGVKCGPAINPMATGAVGMTLSGLKVAVQNIKINVA